jgi:hypothetical protein
MLALSGLSPAPAGAEPLTADARKTLAGQWVPSEGLRCDAACAKRGATAEHMLLYTSDGGDIYLCRVRMAPANRFGNNYEDVCKVEDADSPSGVSLETGYECLCHWPAGERN